MRINLVNIFKNSAAKSLFFIAFIFMAAYPEKTAAQNKDEIAVRKLLSNQTKAWNIGSIDEFMNGYWKNDSLVFIGKKGPNYGYTTALNNYKKNYPDTAAMGQLQFTIVQLKKLSPEYISVVGQWQLQRTIGNVGGYFTLLFRKINKEWVIIMDHTS